MEQTVRTLKVQKHIALVAHDHCKASLLDWVKSIKMRCNLTCYTPPAPPAT